MRLAIAIVVWLALCLPAAAQWTWTEPADYHAAVVQVNVPGAGGSGALIWSDGTVGVVATAKHVIEGHRVARATFQDGYAADGGIVGQGNLTDLAFFLVRVRGGEAVLPIAEQMPQPGDVVEICGYGGPTRQLRHFSGRVLTSTDDELTIDAPVISGDSGGAIVHDGHLVAVNWGARAAPSQAVRSNDGQAWPLVHPATGWGVGPMSRILTQCEYGFCLPPSRQQEPSRPLGGLLPGRGRRQGQDPTAPPAAPQLPQRPQQEPATVPPAGKPCECDPRGGCDCDLDAAMQKMLDAISKHKPAPPTPLPVDPPEAPAQPPSVAECKCDLDGLEKRLSVLIAKACDRPPPSQPEPQKHFVVIGDPKASYYQRLKSDVELTSTFFDSIRLGPPPESQNVGTLPAISFYVGSQHVSTHRGVIAVQSQLYKIRNGEYQ